MGYLGYSNVNVTYIDVIDSITGTKLKILNGDTEDKDSSDNM